MVRNDQLVEQWLDLGAREDFDIRQFSIPGGIRKGPYFEILHTVEELREIAQHFHGQPIEYYAEPRDLLEEYYKQQELKEWIRKGRRVF